MDDAYRKLFSNKTVTVGDSDEVFHLGDVTATRFADIGREDPAVMKALLDQVMQEEPDAWYHLQATIQQLKMKQNLCQRQLQDAKDAVTWRERRDEMNDVSSAVPLQQEGHIHIVLITGFESFNTDLYGNASRQIAAKMPDVRMSVFNDRDIHERPDDLEAALKSASVFFASLIVDYEEALWLRERARHIPTRFVFESALELMSLNKIGTFTMEPKGKSQGAPPAVKKLLSLFGSKKEEDRMLGYLSFLKIGPKILKFIPGMPSRHSSQISHCRMSTGERAYDLQTWLMVYNYWTQGGSENIENMAQYMVGRLRGTTTVGCAAPVETPNTGCVHPDHDGVFATPQEYLTWYQMHGRVQEDAPTVAILLYRKHVITNQHYINDLIRLFEDDGLKPLPIFITGIEAHTVVRDVLTSQTEQQRIASGSQKRDTLRGDAIPVDAVVNTIGFPLVGGPAGSMEAGRQADIAQAILTAKNIPYIVAAPLLVQNLESWMADGVAGLQSVVLYSLPELDGSVDTVPLGGLVGDNIFLIPERVKKLTARVKKWTGLRKKPVHERKLAVLLYGFPPGVGAVGTAALLNVPQSLKSLLLRLKQEVIYLCFNAPNTRSWRLGIRCG